MKKIFALLLLACMVFTLCACDDKAAAGNTDTQAPTEPATEPKTTEPDVTVPATAPVATEPVATEPIQAGPTYVIKVVDEGGNPVEGMFVQLCGEMCIPKMTDANGEAIYADQELRDDYKASVTVYKEGYEAASDQVDYYFEGGFEVTIVVKAVA